MTATHSCTKITWRFFDIVHCLKNLRFKNSNRHPHDPCIIFNELSINLTVTRIHDKENKLKWKLIVPLQFLEQLRHQHRVLAAGNADRNLVSGLNQIIGIDGLGKFAEQCLMKTPLAKTFFNILLLVITAKTGHQPCAITTGQTHCIVIQLSQLNCRICTGHPLHAI